MKNTITSFVAALALCLGVQFGAHANHIDFITDGGFAPIATSDVLGPLTATQTGNTDNILGAERDVTISFASGSGILATATSGAVAGPGPALRDASQVLLFDNSVGALGTLTLAYDGAGVAGPGFGPSDFDSNWDFISVNLADIQGAGRVGVTVTDTSNNSGSLLSPIVSTPGNYFFPFTNANYAGVDFTMVNSVVVTFETTTAATDIAIGEITREVAPGPGDIIVPEPTSLLLFCGGLLGLVLLRRK